MPRGHVEDSSTSATSLAASKLFSTSTSPSRHHLGFLWLSAISAETLARHGSAKILGLSRSVLPPAPPVSPKNTSPYALLAPLAPELDLAWFADEVQWDEYIAYEALKKHIYQVEKQKAGLQESCHDLEANERTSLMATGHSSTDMGNTDAFFLLLLDRERRKICMFYETEEQRLTDDLAALQTDIERLEESGPYAGHRYLTRRTFSAEPDGNIEQGPHAASHPEKKGFAVYE
ncbi:hypothetical protein GSI_09496 [Ganoderma sinense ZZ0214-1]|uniref:SPX domain-containing protein n=1 Tax=Ganoderma sinense ZZ0214-1 TaxID=1077348 RepID=A0A2G8S3N1_9APHY|nr:hypothetical protein GSI_09496 [Ganoderma sinense ZZ0214-1]